MNNSQIEVDKIFQDISDIKLGRQKLWVMVDLLGIMCLMFIFQIKNTLSVAAKCCLSLHEAKLK